MRVQSSWKLCRRIERAEAGLAILLTGTFATLLVISDICGIIIVCFMDKNPLRIDREFVLIVCGFALITILTAMLFLELKRAFDRNRPHPTYELSIAFARRSIYTRVILGGWALVMAGMLAAFGKLWITLIESLRAESTLTQFVTGSAAFVVSLGAMYAANGYLMCFIRAWGMPRSVAKFAYRYRYAIDVTIAGLTTMYFTSTT